MRPTWPSASLDAFVQPLGDRHRALGAEAELRLASCCRVRVVNGGAGERFCVRVPTLVTAGWSVADARRHAASARPRRRRRRARCPSIRTSSAANVSPAAVARQRLDRPVLAGREGVDLALALDDEPHGDGLHAAGGQAAADLAPEQRAERVADEAVDDPARLLGVDEVLVDAARVGERLADRRLGDLVEGHAVRSWPRPCGVASATCQAIASPSRSGSVAR